MTIIRADHLLYGDGRQDRFGEVVIEGDRILSAGPRASGAADGDVLDFGVATILPGLINAHVHLAMDGGCDPLRGLRLSSKEEIYSQVQTNLQSNLAAGVTTVRECGMPHGLDVVARNAVREGTITGPDVIACGRVVTTRGGHLFFMGREADTEDEVVTAVHEIAAMGADFVKVVVSGGRITPGSGNDRYRAQYPVTVLRRLVDEARSMGLRVAAHVHATAAIAVAVDAGVDSIEHCLWLAPEGQHYQEDLIPRMRDQGIFVVPTLSRSFPRPSTGGVPDAVIPDLETHLGYLRSMWAAGVRIVAGGDSGASHTPMAEFPHEIELLVQMGMSPSEAITAATEGAASCLGVSQEVGTLGPGKVANLFVAPGDLSRSVAGLWNPLMVIKRGVISRNSRN